MCKKVCKFYHAKFPMISRLPRQSSPSTTSALRGLPPDMLCCVLDDLDRLSRSTVLTVRPTSASCGSVERNETKSLTLMLLLELLLPGENGFASESLSHCTFSSQSFVMGPARNSI